MPRRLNSLKGQAPAQIFSKEKSVTNTDLIIIILCWTWLQGFPVRAFIACRGWSQRCSHWRMHITRDLTSIFRSTNQTLLPVYSNSSFVNFQSHSLLPNLCQSLNRLLVGSCKCHRTIVCWGQGLMIHREKFYKILMEDLTLLYRVGTADLGGLM